MSDVFANADFGAFGAGETKPVPPPVPPPVRQPVMKQFLTNSYSPPDRPSTTPADVTAGFTKRSKLLDDFITNLPPYSPVFSGIKSAYWSGKVAGTLLTELAKELAALPTTIPQAAQLAGEWFNLPPEHPRRQQIGQMMSEKVLNLLMQLNLPGAASQGVGLIAGKAALPSGMTAAAMIPIRETPTAVKKLYPKLLAKDAIRNVDLWKSTGFWKDNRGYWRYEVNPDNLRLNFSPRHQQELQRTGRLDVPITEIVDYPDLYSAMPDIKNLHLEIDPYMQHTGEFVHAQANQPAKLKLQSPSYFSTLQHEIQHAVEYVANTPLLGSNAGRQAANVWTKTLRGLRPTATPVGQQWIDDAIVKMSKEGNDRYMTHDGGLYDLRTKKLDYGLAGLDDAFLENAITLLREKAYKNYLSDPGEVLARTNAARAKMTPKQRQAEPPWVTMEKVLAKDGLTDFPEAMALKSKVGSSVMSEGPPTFRNLPKDFERKLPVVTTKLKSVPSTTTQPPWRTQSSLHPRAYQEKYPERTVHRDWDKANSPRFIFEAAGDILREFQKDFIAPSYIEEKLGRVNRLIEGELSGSIHPDDSIAAARKYAPEFLKELTDQYRHQPVATADQALAKDAIISLLEGDVRRAKTLYDKVAERISSMEVGPQPAKEPTRLVTKPVRDFYQTFMSDITERTAKALQKVDSYKGWKFDAGDRIRSKQTGRTYEIVGKGWDDKTNSPRYFYKTLDGSERGTFDGLKAHEAFVKFTGPLKGEI